MHGSNSRYAYEHVFMHGSNSHYAYYHVLMHGINLMGSHASQVNQEERWKISQYVLELRNELIK